jgi:mannose/cellobiose epimerase-like protein (N-acyl-D-glucosamine 2-epimerase family)
MEININKPININDIQLQTKKKEDNGVNTDSVTLSGYKEEDSLTRDINQLKQLQAELNPAPGTKAYWKWQAKHMTDFFAKASKDEVNGGFFTNIDSNGNVTDHEKFLMPTSRQVYSYAETYMMTGEKKYLDLAKHGVDFMVKNHMRKNTEGGVYWVEHVKEDGKPAEGEEAANLLINKQTYGLTGLISYYKATKDPEILEIIKSGHSFITNHFTDKEKGGFFDSVNPSNLEPARVKSYNSTVYPATSALLEMVDIADGEWKKELLGQIKNLADNFVEHFPDTKTGFIKENFTEDWQESWRDWQKQPEGSIGVVGHNTQGALFLLRAEKLLGKNDKYSETARNLMDSMIEKGGFDMERGGSYDVFVRETGQKQWHNNKPFWQQEEGYLASLAMYKETGDTKYKEVADKTLDFWDKFFIDREKGGDRQTVAENGTPMNEPKGGPGKSSYHATEMGVLASEIMDW